MPAEEGVVEEIKNRNALVRVKKSSACKNCASRDSCEVNSTRDMLVEVYNEVEAREGDWVELSIPAGSFLGLSIMVYLFPVAGLVVGALLGNEIGRILGLPIAASSVCGGGLLLVLTYYVLKWINNSSGRAEKYRPRMTRIIYRPEG